MKIKISSFLLTMPTMLTLACGDLPVEAFDADIEAVDASAAATLDAFTLTTEQHTNSALAAQVAAHPAFAALSYRAYLRVSDIVEVKAMMTAAELEASYSRLEHCRLVSSSLCTEELYASGVDPVINPTEIQLGQQLNNAFDLFSLTLTQRTLLFREAQLAYVAGGGQPPSLSLIPSTFASSTTVCDQSCKAQILKGLDDAHAGTMARMASEDAGDEGGKHPWWIEIIIAGGTLAVNCLFDPDCYLWPFEIKPGPEPECTHNGDCDSDEYCWKGPLGIGENECRDKKKVGDSCGNDDACKSDCCKFNLWDGGSTCRVASECN